MTLTLHVDAVPWRDHVARTLGDRRDALGYPHGGDIVAVAKGNGYGFTKPVLARESMRAGVDTLAVGTVFEVADVLQHFTRDILVLEPFDPRDVAAAAAWDSIDASPDAARVVRTVASLTAARALANTDVRVVVELLSSVRRFGLTADEIPQAVSALGVSQRIRGVAVHLPIAAPQDGDAVAEVVEAASIWSTTLDALQLGPEHPAHRVFVSHLSLDQLRALRLALPDRKIWPRIGTDLWLGNAAALRTTATVLAVHEPTERSVGYRQRRGSKGDRLIIVSGGTSHGVALAAPSANVSVRSRAIAAANGLLEAAGRTTSPFTIGGAQRLFAEPPHMHVSLVWLPGNVAPPAVGDEVDVRVRNTTANFDRVVGLG